LGRKTRVASHGSATGQRHGPAIGCQLLFFGRALFVSRARAQAVASAFRFLRHQASRPPLAKIRPGRPAPAMGPGTDAIADVGPKSTVGVSFGPRKSVGEKLPSPLSVPVATPNCSSPLPPMKLNGTATSKPFVRKVGVTESPVKTASPVAND